MHASKGMTGTHPEMVLRKTRRNLRLPKEGG